MWSTPPLPVAASARSAIDGGEPGRATARTAAAATAAASASRTCTRRPHARVAEHRRPVAGRAGVGRDGVLEELSHRSTSVSCVCMFECAAWSVADTVPRETPSASAIPA